jgi:hypothetical protein
MIISYVFLVTTNQYSAIITRTYLHIILIGNAQKVFNIVQLELERTESMDPEIEYSSLSHFDPIVKEKS